MLEHEARELQQRIEDLLAGAELGLLYAEESFYIPGSWGVVITLTAMSDYLALQRALRRHGRTRPKFSGKYMVHFCPVCHQKRRFYGRDSEGGWEQVCSKCGHKSKGER